MRTLPSVIVLSMLLALPAQDPTAPRFVTGDAAALVCRAVGSKAGADRLQLLTVEVSNPGPVAAEPLVFELRAPGKKGEAPPAEVFERARLPHFARHGRPVPAGGKQSYPVPTWSGAKPAAIRVQVTGASFVERGELSRPRIEFGTPQQVQRESLVGTFPVTQVTLRNPLVQELDVLLLVKFEQPKDCTELVGVRLPASGAVDVLLATRPGRTVWVDPLMQAPASAVKATTFEVVDWCAVGTAPGEEAIQALREAYEAWYRWPEADLELAGDFGFQERRLKINTTDQYEDLRVGGRFTVDKVGKVGIEIREGAGANASLLLRDVLSNLRRPDFAALAKQNRLAPVTAQRVALHGPGWRLGDEDAGRHRVDGAQQAVDVPDLEVQQGRIVSGGQGAGERTQWEWQLLGAAAVVSRRFANSTDTRFSYASLDGRIVPTSAVRRVQFGASPFSVEELTLTDLRFVGVVPIAPVPPTGEGAAALRTLWEASWHVPVEPIVVEAKFAVQCGNDGVWRGTKKLSGTIVMEGLGRSMRGSDVRFDGALAHEDEVQLAAMLRDRLGIWIARDFNDRAPFDEFFRGSSIAAPDAAGVFVVERGPVASVSTANGLVRGMQSREGGAIAYTYTRIGDRQVVTRIDQKVGGERAPAAQRWEANVQLAWQVVGEHVLPAKMVFERIFGRDWGPESITFRDPRVRAAK